MGPAFKIADNPEDDRYEVLALHHQVVGRAAYRLDRADGS